MPEFPEGLNQAPLWTELAHDDFRADILPSLRNHGLNEIHEAIFFELINYTKRTNSGRIDIEAFTQSLPNSALPLNMGRTERHNTVRSFFLILEDSHYGQFSPTDGESYFQLQNPPETVGGRGSTSVSMLIPRIEQELIDFYRQSPELLYDNYQRGITTGLPQRDILLDQYRAISPLIEGTTAAIPLSNFNEIKWPELEVEPNIRFYFLDFQAQVTSAYRITEPAFQLLLPRQIDPKNIITKLFLPCIGKYFDSSAIARSLFSQVWTDETSSPILESEITQYFEMTRSKTLLQALSYLKLVVLYKLGTQNILIYQIARFISEYIVSQRETERLREIAIKEQELKIKRLRALLANSKQRPHPINPSALGVQPIPVSEFAPDSKAGLPEKNNVAQNPILKFSSGYLHSWDFFDYYDFMAQEEHNNITESLVKYWLSTRIPPQATFKIKRTMLSSYYIEAYNLMFDSLRQYPADKLLKYFFPEMGELIDWDVSFLEEPNVRISKMQKLFFDEHNTARPFAEILNINYTVLRELTLSKRGGFMRTLIRSIITFFTLLFARKKQKTQTKKQKSRAAATQQRTQSVHHPTAIIDIKKYEPGITNIHSLEAALDKSFESWNIKIGVAAEETRQNVDAIIAHLTHGFMFESEVRSREKGLEWARAQAKINGDIAKILAAIPTMNHENFFEYLYLKTLHNAYKL